MSEEIVKFGNTTNVAGATVSEAAGPLGTDTPSWSAAKRAYASMNVIADLKTLTGTNPTVQFKVEEFFAGIWVTTALSTAVNAVGQYQLTQQSPVVVATQTTSVQGAFSTLGSGTDKRITTVVGGTVGAINVDFYLVFFKQ